jgi:hypothetical protein
MFEPFPLHDLLGFFFQGGDLNLRDVVYKYVPVFNIMATGDSKLMEHLVKTHATFPFTECLEISELGHLYATTSALFQNNNETGLLNLTFDVKNTALKSDFTLDFETPHRFKKEPTDIYVLVEGYLRSSKTVALSINQSHMLTLVEAEHDMDTLKALHENKYTNDFISVLKSNVKTLVTLLLPISSRKIRSFLLELIKTDIEHFEFSKYIDGYNVSVSDPRIYVIWSDLYLLFGDKKNKQNELIESFGKITAPPWYRALLKAKADKFLFLRKVRDKFL